MSRGLLQSLVLLTESSNPLLLPALRPKLLLGLLLLQRNDITHQLRFLRVQIGRSAGLKATGRGLLSGPAGICGSTTRHGLLSGPAGYSGEC